MMINFNDTVRVKLTAEGELALTQDDVPFPDADDEGWRSFQLWRLMADLGPYMRLDAPEVIYGSIEIPAPKAIHEAESSLFEQQAVLYGHSIEREESGRYTDAATRWLWSGWINRAQHRSQEEVEQHAQLSRLKTALRNAEQINIELNAKLDDTHKQMANVFFNEPLGLLPQPNVKRLQAHIASLEEALRAAWATAATLIATAEIERIAHRFIRRNHEHVDTDSRADQHDASNSKRA